MGDLSVYCGLYNETNETFWLYDSTGDWGDLPKKLGPGSSFEEFKLIQEGTLTGSEGEFTYNLRDLKAGSKGTVLGQVHTYQTCPLSGSNVVRAEIKAGKPVYSVVFKARVANEKWRDNVVSAAGHPVWVRYYIRYRKDVPYQVKLRAIQSSSAHPVRNSRGELIKGDHVLYDSSNPLKYADQGGSFQPNVFKYDFTSKISDTLDVTVRATDPPPKSKIKAPGEDVLGVEAMIIGIPENLSGSQPQVFQSPVFTFTQRKMTVRVNIINPTKSEYPFSINDFVLWQVVLKRSGQNLKPDGNPIAPLELYWIAKTLHPAFRNSVPVIFLRGVLPYNPPESGVLPYHPVTRQPGATYSEFNRQMAVMVFMRFHKVYDSSTGMSHFGLHAQGGNFNSTFYLLAKDQDSNNAVPTAGSLYPTVNCMDQAAMLELSCSLLSGSASTSWLYQQPFGYIKKSHLVGGVETNNPFYGTDESQAMIDINDPLRRPFDSYVHVGHSKPFRPDTDGIYDGGNGPHGGTQTITDYLNSVIDNETTLYQTRPLAGPGTAQDVATGLGVRIIDNRESVFSQRHTMIPLTEPLSHLLNTAVGIAPTAGPLMYAGWAHLPTWLNATLGNAWNIQYEQVTVGETGAQALWLISDANAPVRVNVNVISVVTEGGHLDMVESTAVVKESISDILMSTQRHDAWALGTLPNFEGVSLQYADHIETGRIVLVAGNVIMDIVGMTSTEALLPYALKLFDQTVRRDVGRLNHSPPAVPVLRRQPEGIGANTDITTVTGIDTRFSLVFSVNCKIVTANAGSEGYGILFDRHIVKELDDGEGCIVEFLFIAAEIGRHRVRVCVADLETMVGAKADLEVEVVGAKENCENEETNTDFDSETESCDD